MEKTENEIFDRKKFLKTAGSGALFAFLGIGFYGCSSSTSSVESNGPTNNDDDNEESGISITDNGNTITIDLTIDDVSALNSSGGWLLINSASTLVVNVDGSLIRAFTSVCTHQGCSDDWSFSDSLFVCNCHDSRFNTGGEVVKGPADRDLEEFSVSRNEDIITITK